MLMVYQDYDMCFYVYVLKRNKTLSKFWESDVSIKYVEW